MQTRVDKYREEESYTPPKRASRNTNLYEEIKNSELDNFSIGSNAKVIADSSSHMDIDKLKEILEKNYQEPPKRSMKFDIPKDEEEIEELKIDEPKEYDINAILEQAREEKEMDYQKERLKKIRDTQYDILKNLELEAKAKEKNTEKSKEELLELINTININESQNKNGKKLKEILAEEEKDDDEMDPLDILTELKGDEDGTKVVGAKEFTEEIQKFEVDSLELKIKNRKKEHQEEQDEEEEDTTTDTTIKDALDETLDESFYTDSATFNPKDFADLEEEGKNGIVVKILIVIVVLAIVAGVVLFLNEFLGLGWF